MVLIQFGRKQNEGADPDLIRQRIVEFSEELNLTRPDIWNRAVVISNFMFTQKAHEEDWRIDEVHTGSNVEIGLYLADFLGLPDSYRDPRFISQYRTSTL
jgi:hypothetical protein